MRIQLWKGYHSAEIRKLIVDAWRSEDQLLILCPPQLQEFKGWQFLPQGPVDFFGDWDTERPQVDGRTPWAHPEKPVLGLFTTGTSAGEAKLVLYSKKCILSSLRGILDFFNAERISEIFCYPQPFHTFGLLLGYILAEQFQWPLTVPIGKYSTSAHALWCQGSNPGRLSLGTPTHFQDLISYIQREQRSVSSSYSCIVGGASVPVALWQRLQSELKIESPSIGYGATEASPGVAHLPAGCEPKEDNEVGLPLKNLTMELNPGQGYQISGPGVCLSIVTGQGIDYPQKIVLGDELRQRSDGVLVFSGRSDLVLNRGGEKFALEGVEIYLRQSLGLECMAFAVPDLRLGFELGLLIQGPFDCESLTRALWQRFQVHFATENFRSIERFPLNSNLKLDRKAALTWL